MVQETVEYSANKKELYEEVALQLRGLFEDCPHVMANLANASALLNQAMKDINWVGFYLIEAAGDGKSEQEAVPEEVADGEKEVIRAGEKEVERKESVEKKKGEGREEILVLGPFQGRPACVEIKVGKGVCGTAVAEDRIQLVKDVHAFPGHIACDSTSNSEIVLPIHKGGKVWGVLDIDSPVLGRFDEEDQVGLEKVVGVVEAMLEGNGKK